MASSAELALSKASLTATLFRADPTPCTRDEIDDFFRLLNAAVVQCSPANVQKVKQWTLAHIVPSRSGRFQPVGRYLLALSQSFTADQDKPRVQGQKKEPSARRKRLHIIYVLHDVMYHAKTRLGNDNFPKCVEQYLPALVRLAASFPDCPKHARKLRGLVDLWEGMGYWSATEFTVLRRSVDSGLLDGGKGRAAAEEKDKKEEGEKKKGRDREVPFVMPAMHGDPSMPWYDLPAGNWLPVLEPDSTRPMKPDMIKPLQLAPGPAEKGLVEAVNRLLGDVERLYNKGDGLGEEGKWDVDQMGEVVHLDEEGRGETYYGWSRKFCEKMRARRKGGRDGRRASSGSYTSSSGRSRSRSRMRARDSRSRSRSSSRPGMKRRRLSSYSRSPPRKTRDGNSRSRSRSRSRGWDSRRRSISPSRSRSGSPPASPRYSPPSPGFVAYINNAVPGDGYGGPSVNEPPQFLPGQAPSPGGMPQHMQSYGGYQQYPNQPPHMSVPPPPPPPHYQGQWPPPPPPPPSAGPQQNYFQGAPPMGMPPYGGGGWPVPPPPPMGMGMMPTGMNQQQQQHQPQHDPRGQYGYGGRGGGGYGRGNGYGRGGW